jgi:hypothetical protein
MKNKPAQYHSRGGTSTRWDLDFTHFPSLGKSAVLMRISALRDMKAKGRNDVHIHTCLLMTYALINPDEYPLPPGHISLGNPPVLIISTFFHVILSSGKA